MVSSPLSPTRGVVVALGCNCRQTYAWGKNMHAAGGNLKAFRDKPIWNRKCFIPSHCVIWGSKNFPNTSGCTSAFISPMCMTAQSWCPCSFILSYLQPCKQQILLWIFTGILAGGQVWLSLQPPSVPCVTCFERHGYKQQLVSSKCLLLWGRWMSNHFAHFKKQMGKEETQFTCFCLLHPSHSLLFNVVKS